jgi:hypothetical protein
MIHPSIHPSPDVRVLFLVAVPPAPSANGRWRVAGGRRAGAAGKQVPERVGVAHAKQQQQEAKKKAGSQPKAPHHTYQPTNR